VKGMGNDRNIPVDKAYTYFIDTLSPILHAPFKMFIYLIYIPRNQTA
jgi:hypothetical protein